jgi:mono/diheme cytochrome c family protein
MPAFRPHFLLAAIATAAARAQDPQAEYEERILPILEDHCFSCHGDGEDKGKVAFDTYGSLDELLAQTKLWDHALRNVRAGLMPPAKKKRLPDEDLATLVEWIKRRPLGLDPANPDPGRVTLRRLNRIEYRNTVRELTGHDFRTDEEFPADDTGYGFDNIGDVLTTSPMLLEKYMQAAESIVEKAVPLQNRVAPSRTLAAGMFRGRGERGREDWQYRLSLYEPADLTGQVEIEKPGTYRVILNARPSGSFSYDPGRARVRWSVDGTERLVEETRWGGPRLVSEHEVKWPAGTHTVRLTLEPLVGKDQQPPDLGDGPPFVDLELGGITLVGPLEPEHSVHPPNYGKFFTRDRVPEDAAEQDAYREEILRRFATRAFRRPADDAIVAKLVALARATAEAEGGSFEKGIARSIAAVLASPRFLFRLEQVLPTDDPAAHPLLDEWSLASRLSYFLWSTLPDDELLRLAAAGELRKNLPAQVKRMLADGRSDEFVRHFAGQWMQARDVEGVSIDARVVLARDAGTEKENRERFENFRRLNREIDAADKAGDAAKLAALREEMAALRARFRGQGRIEFGGSLRHAMRRELELLFRHVLREDRSVLELVDNPATFLNEELARHYGIPGVSGGEMRLVELPPDSPRGGVLTMGSVLAVTSNPTRTSPVKRGVFILDNILGTPPPPAPPDVPSLEEAGTGQDGEELALREALALHREKPLCSSCHDRMDPLGLAFENFNALGAWRDQELGRPLPPVEGRLVTGETFSSVQELKRLLVTERRQDYYRCLTEKVLTYALGRGPEPCDTTTVDEIVGRLEESGGRFSTLLTGIIESPAFQKRRRTTP